MYVLNKIVWICLNPIMLGLVAIAACGAFAFFRRRRLCIFDFDDRQNAERGDPVK